LAGWSNLIIVSEKRKNIYLKQLQEFVFFLHFTMHFGPFGAIADYGVLVEARLITNRELAIIETAKSTIINDELDDSPAQ
jgi:hypothetical protein